TIDAGSYLAVGLRRIPVLEIIAGRKNDEGALGHGVPDGSFDDGSAVHARTSPAVGGTGAAQAQVEDFGAMIGGVPNAKRHALVRTHMRRPEDVVPLAVDDLHRHDFDVEPDAGLPPPFVVMRPIG